jgi:hypothetical protein
MFHMETESTKLIPTQGGYRSNKLTTTITGLLTNKAKSKLWTKLQSFVKVDILT